MQQGRAHNTSYDAVIIGAGAIGSAAAIALARDGARCLLLEAAPDAIRRYAGEWMHPTVLQLMEQLGIEQPAAARENDAGRGFVVHPEDGSDPITLDYPAGARGFCCSHYELSLAIREQAARHPSVEYVPFARAVDVQRDGRVRYYVAEEHGDREVHGDLIVGAEGRSSICRRVMQADTNRDVVSYMAALRIGGDVALPDEGYGHIFMGAPGLALAYRVSRDEVRLCLDVPASQSALRHDLDGLYEAYHRVLPEELRRAAREAIAGRDLRWSATFFQPRTERGADRLVLVGDAVGLCHPLCSAGVAVGLLDVMLLRRAVRDGDLDAYRRDGARETWVPELMSCAVYQLLGRPDVGDEVRQAMYSVWREDPIRRDLTMNILMGAERMPAAFVGAFAHVGSLAAVSAIRGRRGRGGAARTVLPAWGRAKGLAAWLRWPVASVLPPWIVDRVRPRSTIDAPF